MSWSVRTRRLPAPLALVLALSACLVALAGPSQAYPGQTTSNGQSGVVGGCYATAGPNYLGLACPGRGKNTGTPQYPSSFLCKKAPAKDKPGPFKPEELEKSACEKLPPCWTKDALTEEELKAVGVENSPGPDGITYYWRRCLNGISGNLEVKNATVTQSILARPNSSEEPLIELIPEQQQLVNYYFDPEAGSRVPPSPTVVTSPNFLPRVRTDVSFYDGNIVDPDDVDAQDPGTKTSVLVEAGGVQLLAVEDSIRITPPDTDDVVRCGRRGADSPAGAGFDPNADVGYRAEPGQTRANTPEGNCWYQFTRSSAGQRYDTYQLPATSHWKVWAKDGDGAWAPFTSLGGNEVEFEKTGSAPLKVSEVQAINVLPNGVLS